VEGDLHGELDEGGEAACYAHLLCPECSAVITDSPSVSTRAPAGVAKCSHFEGSGPQRVLGVELRDLFQLDVGVLGSSSDGT
jgi:hypothetical protein